MTLDLASAARAELTSRQREPEWDAADLEAWRTIAALFGDGVDAVEHWLPLLAAARAAEDRRHAAWLNQRDPAKREGFGLRLAALITIRGHLELRAVTAGELAAAQCGPTPSVLQAAA